VRIFTKAVASVVSLALALGAASCARAPVSPGSEGKALFGFPTEEQRILACLDLQDHIVDIFAEEYVSRENVRLTANQRQAFRAGWAEQLAKGGTFEPFELSCFGNLTTTRYDCGMSSRTTRGVEACMRLSER
jgi:hypothetical protein